MGLKLKELKNTRNEEVNKRLTNPWDHLYKRTSRIVVTKKGKGSKPNTIIVKASLARQRKNLKAKSFLQKLPH